MRYIDNLRPGDSICGPFLVRDAPGVIVEFVNWSLEIRENGAISRELTEAMPAHLVGQIINYRLLHEIGHAIVKAVRNRPQKRIYQCGIRIKENNMTKPKVEVGQFWLCKLGESGKVVIGRVESVKVNQALLYDLSDDRLCSSHWMTLVNGAPTDDCWELLSADTRGLREALATEVTERQRLEKQVTELQAEGTRLTLENRELARTAKAEKDDFEHQLIDSQERASHLSEQLKERTKQRDCALKQAAESQDALDNVAAEYREFRKNPKRPDQIRIGCRGSGAHISRIDLNTDRWHRFMATADVTGAGIDARISFCDIGTAEQFKKEICRNVAAIVIELA